MDSLLSNRVESPINAESSKESNFDSEIFSPSRCHRRMPADNLTFRWIKSDPPEVLSLLRTRSPPAETGCNECSTERSVVLVDDRTRGLRLSTIGTESNRIQNKQRGKVRNEKTPNFPLQGWRNSKTRTEEEDQMIDWERMTRRRQIFVFSLFYICAQIFSQITFSIDLLFILSFWSKDKTIATGIKIVKKNKIKIKIRGQPYTHTIKGTQSFPLHFFFSSDW